LALFRAFNADKASASSLSKDSDCDAKGVSDTLSVLDSILDGINTKGSSNPLSIFVVDWVAGLEDMGLEDMGLEDMGLEDMGLEDMGLEDMGLVKMPLRRLMSKDANASISSSW